MRVFTKPDTGSIPLLQLDSSTSVCLIVIFLNRTLYILFTIKMGGGAIYEDKNYNYVNIAISQKLHTQGKGKQMHLHVNRGYVWAGIIFLFFP